jgi:hypothetical protein
VSRYRNAVAIRPGPPLDHHRQWVCVGCGVIEWMPLTWTRERRRWHCDTAQRGVHCDGEWAPLTDYAPALADAMLVAFTMAGPPAVLAMLRASAEDGSA